MNNILFRNFDNHIFKALFIKYGLNVGHIVGLKQGNVCNISSLYIQPEYRSRMFGTSLLNFFETKMYYDYNINKFTVMAWDNTYCKNTSYSKFYFRNNYIINKKIREIYHDNGDKIYTITPLEKYK